MTSSTLTTASATAPCQTVGWCAGHEETHAGILVHLSEFEIGRTGVVTGIKAYSRTDGEPIGGATVLMFEPLADTPSTPEAWRLAALRQIAAA